MNRTTYTVFTKEVLYSLLECYNLVIYRIHWYDCYGFVSLLQRQSLHSLQEKRDSLLQQLQEINKEALIQDTKLEAMSETLPNLFKYEDQFSFNFNNEF